MNRISKRIVTGLDASGRLVAIEAGPAPHRVTLGRGFELVEQWTSKRIGAGLLDEPDATTDELAVLPPREGVIFRVVTFPPDPEGQMHRTDTVDLVTIVQGELTLALKGGEEFGLQPGDTVVQRGAAHAWRNHTDRPAVAAVVLLSGESS